MISHRLSGTKLGERAVLLQSNTSVTLHTIHNAARALRKALCVEFS